MTTDALEEHYSSLERDWRVLDASNDLARLVVPTGNHETPLHRWFHLKEAFSHSLLARIIKDISFEDRGELAVLDPFSGVGTSLASAIQYSASETKRVNVVALEQNPFLHLASSSKAIAADADAPLLASDFESAATEVAMCPSIASLDALDIPALSAWNNERFIDLDTRQSLLQLRDNITTRPPGRLRDLLLFAAASCVEDTFRLRRDGRALRFDPRRNLLSPTDSFLTRVSRIATDLKLQPNYNASAEVFHGDARQADQLAGRSFDLIIFSPPYPNNIDYTEVYKLESWYLGHYTTQSEFREQRERTIRSHPSVLSQKPLYYLECEHVNAIEELIGPILDAIPADRYMKGRMQVTEGYVDDMYKVLSACRRTIRPDGRLVFVVGNSAHGADSSYIIAADLLLARLGELSGWAVEDIRIARRPTRRTSKSSYLRESVVTLRPAPEAIQ